MYGNEANIRKQLKFKAALGFLITAALCQFNSSRCYYGNRWIAVGIKRAHRKRGCCLLSRQMA